MSLTWTHSWSSSDDGTVLGGGDLGSIQGNIDSQTMQLAGTQTVTGVKTFDDIKIKSPYVDVRTYASINAAVTAIGATETTCVITNAQTLTASLTIPSTLSLMIIKGGSIVKASTYTLTINGNFEAGLYQVFSGFSTGNIHFGMGAVKEVYPEWWGIDGTNDSTEVQCAIDAADGAIVKLSAKRYYFGTAGVSRTNNFNMWGSGNGVSYEDASHGTGIYYSGTGYAITVGNGVTSIDYGNSLRDFCIYLTEVNGAGKGMKIWGTSKSYFENIDIEGEPVAGRSNIGVLIDAGDTSSYFNTFTNITCHHMWKGFVFAGQASYVTNATFIGCTNYGDETVLDDDGIGIDSTENTGGAWARGITWIGGNLENNGIAINIAGNSSAWTFVGTRFQQAAFTDIVFGTYSRNCGFYNCAGLTTVTDNSIAGYGRHHFLGCSTTSYTDYPNKVNTLNLIAGQLTFPATQVPSAGVNTMDDYKEGIWTAGLTCGTSGTITLLDAYKTGAYTKKGREVTVTITIGVDSVSSPVGSLTVTGLPFTVGSTVRFKGGVSLYCDTLNATATTAMQGYVANNTTTIIIEHFAAGVSAAAAADIKAGSIIILSATYFTD